MNDIDRRVAEILGTGPVITIPGPITSYPAYSTDQALIGEMLAWIAERTYAWELCSENAACLWVFDENVSLDAIFTDKGASTNLALCNAIIAINTTPADAGEQQP